MGMRAAVAVSAVLAVGLNGAPAGAADRPEAQVALDLRVYTYERLSTADAQKTREVAEALLAAAGIRMTWRACGGREDTCGEPTPPNTRTVLVHVVSARNPAKPSISGDAMPASSALRMVRIYLPRIAEMVETFRRLGPRQSLPQLTTLTVGHLVGLTIAHEVGHTLGLRHSQAGIMRAQLGVEEVVAARSETLAFRPVERERMARALRPAEVAVARDRRPR